MIIFVTGILIVAPAASQAPTQACLEILADAEGEMGRANDPLWQRRALSEIEKMRAERDRHRSRTDSALAKNSKRRDRLQHDFSRREIREDDFNAARSEIDAEARRLIAERDTQQIPACGL